MKRLSAPLLLLATLTLAGCDMLGIESTQAVAERKEADGRAVGGACRHAGRAIEDCYALNKKAERAAVFAGWRDMNDYMRENKIDVVPPQLSPSGAITATAAVESEEPKKGAGAAKHDS